MKRLVVIVALVLMTAAAYGQMSDGFDWVQWNDTQKTFFVSGVFDTLQVCIESFGGMVTTEEEAVEVSDMFYIAGTVGDLVDEIDRVYSTYDYRDVPVLVAVLIATGKYDRWFGGTDD